MTFGTASSRAWSDSHYRVPQNTLVENVIKASNTLYMDFKLKIKS